MAIRKDCNADFYGAKVDVKDIASGLGMCLSIFVFVVVLHDTRNQKQATKEKWKMKQYLFCMMCFLIGKVAMPQENADYNKILELINTYSLNQASHPGTGTQPGADEQNTTMESAANSPPM